MDFSFKIVCAAEYPDRSVETEEAAEETPGDDDDRISSC